MPFAPPEFCDGGELVDRVSHLNPMSEGTASRIVRQLCEALVHLHDQGVAHMDLKPENIVFKTKCAPPRPPLPAPASKTHCPPPV